VVGAAALATVASYEHAYAFVRAYGEAGWTGRLVPLTVDGLIYASSMAMLDSVHRRRLAARTTCPAAHDREESWCVWNEFFSPEN